MTPREAIARLTREGWIVRPGKGSHLIFTRGDRKTVVSNHRGDIPTGTLRSICRQAGWTFPPGKGE